MSNLPSKEFISRDMIAQGGEDYNFINILDA